MKWVEWEAHHNADRCKKPDYFFRDILVNILLRSNIPNKITILLTKLQKLFEIKKTMKYQARNEIAKKLLYKYDERHEELQEKKVRGYMRSYTVNPVKVMYGNVEYRVIYYKQPKGPVVIESINEEYIEHKQYKKKNILEEACRLEVAKFILAIEKRKETVELQKEIIEQQRKEIEQQKEIIELQKKELEEIKAQQRKKDKEMKAKIEEQKAKIEEQMDILNSTN